MANNQTTVKVSADASGYTAELDRARKSADAFSASQTAAAQRVATAQKAIAEAATTGSKASASAINNFVSQLARTADQAGKTRAQLLEMKAAQLGISDSVSSYISTIDKASESTHGFNLNTMSARRELLVLAHEASQGNWTKFGGSLGVLAERTDALSAILSAAGLGVGLFAGAVTFAGVEIYKTVTAINALQKASYGTNGYLGLTNDELTAMATRLAGANGGLVEVSATMASLIGSGQASKQTIEQLTDVVTQFGHDAGLTTEKAAEAFVKLIEDPKKGIDELQSKYHTFSAAQIEVINGYVKTGDTAKATQAFIDAVAESQHRMAEQGTKEVGILARIWKSFSDAAKQAGDNFDRMGVAASNAEKLTAATERQAAAQQNLVRAQKLGPAFATRAQTALDAANAEVAAIQKVQDAQKKAADDNAKRARSGDAKVAVDKYLDDSKYASPAEQQKLELAAENANFVKATADLDKSSADYQAALKRHYGNVQTINEQYAKKTRVHTNEGGINAELTRIAGQNQLIAQEEKRAETVLKSQRDAGLIDNAEYFQKLHDLQAAALDQEIANAQKRVDVAQSKKEKVALENALKDYKSLVEQRKAVDVNLADSVQKYTAQRVAAVQKYADQEAQVLNKQQTAFATQYTTRNMSSLDKADYDARLKIVTDYEAQRQALLLQYDSPTADKVEYQQKLAIAQQAYEDQSSALENSLTVQKQLRDNYDEQIKKSFTDLAGNSQTTAELVGTGFTSVFSTMESSLESFVTTGKFSFSQFASSVLADMAKIALKAAETQIFNMVASSFSTGGPVGSPQSFATGGPIYGAGTGTSDSIPAMLSNGEFVINAASTKKYSGILAAINSGKLSHFATGGAVGSVASSSTSAASGATSPVSVTVHNNGGSDLNDKDAADLHAMVTAFVDKRMAQKMRGQGGYSYQMKHGQI